jgi:hypothetical protein
MAEEQTRWTHDDVKTLLERGTIADLEKLIAHPGSQYRQEKANSYAVNALKLLAESDVLPDDIRILVQRIFELHETACNPFLGMNIEKKDAQA